MIYQGYPTDNMGKCHSRPHLVKTIKEMTALLEMFDNGGPITSEEEQEAERIYQAELWEMVMLGIFGSDEETVFIQVRQRSARFPDAFSVSASTPTIKGSCRIEAEFDQSDQRFWFVRCPHCRHEFCHHLGAYPMAEGCRRRR